MWRIFVTMICMINFLLSKVWRRPSIGHADPLGGDFPVVTKDGHNVLDVIFTSPIADLGMMLKPDLLLLFSFVIYDNVHDFS